MSARSKSDAMCIATDGDSEQLTIECLPLDVLAYLCSFMTRYELGLMMVTSTTLASVIIGAGYSRVHASHPTRPTMGPLRNVYMYQYFDRRGCPCLRAWRKFRHDDVSRLSHRARVAENLGQGQAQASHTLSLPLAVPHKAWCMPRAPVAKLVGDLIGCYILFGNGRQPHARNVIEVVLNEPFPPGTLFCVVKHAVKRYVPVSTYTDAFALMVEYERANTPQRPAAVFWWDREVPPAYSGPLNLDVSQNQGNIVITMNMS